MSVRSKRLAGPVELGAVADAVYTAPLGRTALIKQVRVVNTSGDTQTLRMAIGELLLGNALLWDAPIVGNRAFIDTSWFVLNAEDVLTFAASEAGVLVVTLFGAELREGL